MRNLALIFTLSFMCNYSVYAQIMDPAKLLKPPGGTQYERQGHIFWNLESEKHWAERLKTAPLKLEKVFMRWNPQGRRSSDYSIMLCFDRKLQKIERNSLYAKKKISAIIKFKTGKSVNSSLNSTSGDYDLEKMGLENRCWLIGEFSWHPGIRWQDHIIVSHEQRFRPENIEKVTLKVSRPTKYEGVSVQTYEITDIVPFIDPNRYYYKGSGPPEVHPMTKEFIRGRVLGEALQYGRKCPALNIKKSYSPPEENDMSEYAMGFSAGWDIGAHLIRNQTRVCEVVPKFFDVKQHGVKNPFGQ